MPADLPAEARIEFRIQAENKRYIERAAALQGRTMSDFAKNALLDQAKAVIAQYDNVTLSQRAQESFLAMLDEDDSITAAAAAAAERYRKRSL